MGKIILNNIEYGIGISNGYNIDITNLVEKDSIVTTLDDTVTDEQIPSAKAVYDKMLTEEDVLAIVNKEGVKLINDANDEMLTNGKYATTPTTTNLPFSTYGILTIEKYKDTNSLWVKQTYRPYTNQIYVRGKINDLEWSAWDLVCATKVADVPFTTLPVNDWAIGTVSYTVKNGICYVWANTLSSSTMAQSNQIIVSNLPAPKNAGLWHNIASNDCTKGSLLIQVNEDGELMNYSGLNNAVYYGSFSYPVAE